MILPKTLGTLHSRRTYADNPAGDFRELRTPKERPLRLRRIDRGAELNVSESVGAGLRRDSCLLALTSRIGLAATETGGGADTGRRDVAVRMEAIRLIRGNEGRSDKRNGCERAKERARYNAAEHGQSFWLMIGKRTGKEPSS